MSMVHPGLQMCGGAEASELPGGKHLPMFESLEEALQVAGPTATADSSHPWIQINTTHHLEVQVTPWESLPETTATATVLEQGAHFAVSTWRDKSNNFGLSLGPDGVTVFRALGGPAMDMLIICCLHVTAAFLTASGFTSAGVRLHPFYQCTAMVKCFHCIFTANCVGFRALVL